MNPRLHSRVSRCPARSVTRLLSLAVVVGLAGTATADAGRDEVRASVAELQAWLDRSPHAAGWRHYLAVEQLERQLALAEPDLVELSAVWGRFEREVPGLEHPRFVRVRQSLGRWMPQVAVPREALPDTARRSREAFRPLTGGDVRQSRRRLQAAIGDLDRLLARAAARDYRRWQEYLQWDAMLAELDRDDPDLARLNEVLLQYYGEHPGLELAAFRRLRDALRQYMNAQLFAGQPDLEEAFRMRLDELAARLDAYESDPSREHAEALGMTLGWLDHAQQVPWLLAAVRRHYQRPNFHAHLSSRLIDHGFRDEVDEVTTISDVVLGTPMRGTAQLRGVVNVVLVPHAERATVELHLTGSATSDNASFPGPVVVYTRGQTSIQASKRLLITAEGIGTEPAAAHCELSSTILAIAARHNLVRRIAWRQAERQRPAAEQVAARRAEQRVAEQMDAETAARLVEVNEAFDRQFRSPLLRRDAFPESLRFTTSESYLTVRSLQANAFQLAATAAPPRLVAHYDLAVQLHESMLANTTEPLLGGRTVTHRDIAELAREILGEVPPGLADPDEPWSLTFSSRAPLAARFRDDTITLSLRGRRFTRGNDVIPDTIEISATYRAERTEPGVRLERVGDVGVEYVGRRRLSARQVAFRTFLTRQFEPLFRPEFRTEGLLLPGRWGEAGTMHLEDLTIATGWVAAGWRAAEDRGP